MFLPPTFCWETPMCSNYPLDYLEKFSQDYLRCCLQGLKSLVCPLNKNTILNFRLCLQGPYKPHGHTEAVMPRHFALEGKAGWRGRWKGQPCLLLPLWGSHEAGEEEISVRLEGAVIACLSCNDSFFSSQPKSPCNLLIAMAIFTVLRIY